MVEIENMVMAEKAKFLRKALNLTQKQISDAISEGENRLRRWQNIESGTIKTLNDFEIDRLVNDFGVNKVWLVLGDGEPFNDTKNLVEYIKPKPPASVPNVHVLDIVALADPNGQASQLSELPDRVIYLPNLPKGHTYYAVGIQGDSMQPYYTDTDKIVVREIATQGKGTYYALVNTGLKTKTNSPQH